MEDQGKIVTFTRKELYDLVWSTPMLTVSRMYKISDTGLRKMCGRLKVPTPPAGYWRKIEVGEKPKKKPLNQSLIPAQEKITLVKREENESITSPITILKEKIESEYQEYLIVREHFYKPHELIIEAKNSYKERDQWQTQELMKSGVYMPKCTLCLRISPKSRNRALRFLDTFIKLMIKRGHSVVKSAVVIQGYTCPFRVDEILQKDTNGRESNTGRLMFRIEGKTGWHKISDGKSSQIESRLAEIVAAIEDSINRKIKEQIENEKYRAMLREEQRIREEAKQKVDNEIKQFQQLIKNAKRFKEMEIVRDYLRHIAINATRNGEFNEELIAYVEWGKKKCDWYDPSTLQPDEILIETDRDKIDIEPKKEDRPWPSYRF